MNNEKLKTQLSDRLLGISKKCVAGALVVAGVAVAGQASNVDAAVIDGAAASVAVESQSGVVSEDAAILLGIANPEAGDQLAGHYSHTSHVSHASHASHVSHYSSRL